MLHQKLKASNYHIIFPFFLLLFLAVGTFFAITQSQNSQNKSSRAATTNCTVTAAQMTIKQQEQALFDKVNAYRVQNGLDRLTWDNTLKQAAAWQSADMRSHGTISHNDSLGRATAIRLNECGYQRSSSFGENLALQTTNPDSAFNYWKDSFEHNQVMLVSGYNTGAVAMDVDSTGQYAYWTLNLGVNTANLPTATLAPDGPTLPPVNNPTPTPIPPTVPGQPTADPTDTGNPTTNPTQSGPTATLAPGEPTPTPATVVVDMKINVKVKIAGIGSGGNTSPKHLTRKVRAIISDVGKEPVTTGTGFLTYDNNGSFNGVIHLGKLNEGAYFVTLVGDGTLQVLAQPEFQKLLGGRVNEVPSVTLYQGNMDDNNILNIEDYNIALPCFQNKLCDTANIIDFNDDGATNVTDYNLLLQSFEALRGN